MKYSDWLENVRPKLTGKGARLDLHLYVYPDGHGNIIVESDRSQGQPVNDSEEAAQVFQDLWQKALTAQQAGRQTERQKRLAALLDQITEESLHGEVDFGGPVGQETW